MLLRLAPLLLTVTALDLVYPRARLLSQERVVGTQLEIHWRCYATLDPLEKVAAHYRKDARLDPGGWRMGKDEHGFQLKSDPDLHVAIFKAADRERHPNCRAPLERGEQTLLQISQARPRPAAGP